MSQAICMAMQADGWRQLGPDDLPTFDWHAPDSPHAIRVWLINDEDVRDHRDAHGNLRPPGWYVEAYRTDLGRPLNTVIHRSDDGRDAYHGFIREPGDVLGPLAFDDAAERARSVRRTIRALPESGEEMVQLELPWVTP